MGEKTANKRTVFIFLAIMGISGLALGLSDSVFANYYKDAYDIDAMARGIIELPRELPGVLTMLIISAAAFLGDVRLAIIAQALGIAGLVVLGLFTPPFGVMLLFLFINSLGMHMFMPLGESMGMSLAVEGGYGRMMGKVGGVRTALSMLAAIIVFFGFKTGFFSFKTPVKLVFLISAALLAVVLVLLFFMPRAKRGEQKRVKLVLKKEYSLYYFIAILFGARKQIMYVYGPWVLIDLLGFGADTMAVLSIAGAAIGILFIPAVGRWVDRFGTAKIMMIEAAAFIAIYFGYGALSAGLSAGSVATIGAPVIIAFGINMIDRMAMQLGMVRSVYMRKIAIDESDVTPTLSVGMALDHVLSIASAVLCGFIWRELGPQYVFVLAAALSAMNMLIAIKIRKTNAAH